MAPAGRVEEDAARLGKAGPGPEIEEAVLLVAIPWIVLCADPETFKITQSLPVSKLGPQVELKPDEESKSALQRLGIVIVDRLVTGLLPLLVTTLTSPISSIFLELLILSVSTAPGSAIQGNPTSRCQNFFSDQVLLILSPCTVY